MFIVVPCFNEAGRWDAAYWDAMLAVEGVQWVFVDDGSTDGTAALLAETATRANVSVHRLSVNAGKAEAVRQGMEAVLAEGDVVEAVGYMDADGAFNVSDVQDILRVFRERTAPAGDATAVWSSRVALAGRDIKRSTSRHYIGRIVATLVSIGQTQIPYDTQSGLKLFVPTEDLAACLATPFRTRWLFELELLSRWQGVTGARMRIWEEPLNFWHDVPGSKIRGSEAVRVLRELAVVKVEQRRLRRAEPDGAAISTESG